MFIWPRSRVHLEGFWKANCPVGAESASDVCTRSAATRSCSCLSVTHTYVLPLQRDCRTEPRPQAPVTGPRAAQAVTKPARPRAESPCGVPQPKEDRPQSPRTTVVPTHLHSTDRIHMLGKVTKAQAVEKPESFGVTSQVRSLRTGQQGCFY